MEFTTKQWPGLPVSTGLESTYTEKLNIGYRWYDTHKVAPKFAFGHGLSCECDPRDLQLLQPPMLRADSEIHGINSRLACAYVWQTQTSPTLTSRSLGWT
jgi:hypothetical protein